MGDNSFYLPKEIIKEIGKYSYPDDYDKLKDKVHQLKRTENICFNCLCVSIVNLNSCHICNTFLCDDYETNCNFEYCYMCYRNICKECSKTNISACSKCDKKYCSDECILMCTCDDAHPE